MLLKSLEIKNFRGFKHLQVEKLGHVNLIVGKNNVGKSSILEALRVYAAKGEDSLLGTLAQARGELPSADMKLGLDVKGTHKYAAYESFFYKREYKKNDREPNVISIGEIGGTQPLTIRHTYAKDGEDPNDNPDRSGFNLSSWTPVLAVENSTEKHLINLEHFKQSFLPTNTVRSTYCPPDISNALRDIASAWDTIVLTPDEPRVIQALQIIEPNLTNIAFKEISIAGSLNFRQPHVKLENLLKPIPLLSMGDGMSRIFQIAVHAVLANNGFLLIDEFENGLHHGAQKRLWQFIFDLSQELHIQVFATTHSLDCLKAFSAVAQEKTDLDGVVFRLGRSAMKSNKGDIIATVMDEDGLSRLLAMELEVH